MNGEQNRKHDIITHDYGYRSDSSCTQIPVLICTDDATTEGVTVKLDPCEDTWQSKYMTTPTSQENDSNSLGLKRSSSSQGNLLAVGEEKQSRKRAGSFGIVARRRSIFEIEDQERFAADPLDETIVILTNAEKREKETKKEGFGNLTADSALRTSPTSYGKGLVANRRSVFES